jgi:5-methylcytosine-specific restriction endonuclease McrA
MSKTKTTVKDVTNWMLNLCLIRGEALHCRICREPMFPEQKIHWDHVHCEALDGPHHFTNLRPTHANCNLKKGGRETKVLAKIDRITGVTGNGPKRQIPPRTNPWPPKGSRKLQSRKMR